MIYIFDFDGTIARLFANTDLRKTSEELADAMVKYGVSFNKESDAFDIFSLLANTNITNIDIKPALAEADQILSKTELEAVDSCEVIPGAIEYIGELIKRGEKVAIATNNSEACVRRFASKHWPGKEIIIVGRDKASPTKMKPDPWCLKKASEMIGESDKTKIIFMGDNPRDYECAVNFGCKFIGIAPNEFKYNRFKKYLDERDIVKSYKELACYKMK